MMKTALEHPSPLGGLSQTGTNNASSRPLVEQSGASSDLTPSRDITETLDCMLPSPLPSFSSLLDRSTDDIAPTKGISTFNLIHPGTFTATSSALSAMMLAFSRLSPTLPAPRRPPLARVKYLQLDSSILFRTDVVAAPDRMLSRLEVHLLPPSRYELCDTQLLCESAFGRCRGC